MHSHAFMKPSPKVHDSVVRALFESTDVAQAFFTTFLPQELVKRLDLAQLQACPEHFTDKKLDWCVTDLLFRCPLDLQQAFLYLLFEHQSSVDRWMAFRMLRSTVLIWNLERKRNPDAHQLPVIIPIVLSHAKDSWWAAVEVQDLVLDFATLPTCLQDKVPQQSYYCFDLTQMSNEHILSLASIGALRLFLLILRNIRNPQLPQMLMQWHELWARVMNEPSGLRVMEILLTYLSKASPTVTRKTLMDVGKLAGMDPELVEGSLAWKWMEEGRQEGQREGTKTVLKRLLEMRFAPLPPWVQTKVKNASHEELDRWLERLLEADSIETLFA